MRVDPVDLSQYITEADMPAVSLGLTPTTTTISGYLDDGAAKSLARLCPTAPGLLTVQPLRRWWQWRRRPAWSVLARVTGVTETADGLTMTMEQVSPYDSMMEER